MWLQIFYCRSEILSATNIEVIKQIKRNLRGRLLIVKQTPFPYAVYCFNVMIV